jgi:hypothetical protein
MIEFTTGIILLLSSMYGTSATTTDVVTIQSNIATSTDNLATSTVTIGRKDVEKYLREHYSDTPILIEIAKCESTLMHYNKNGGIIRGNVDKADIGVMQINERYHLETAVKLGYDIHSIEGNVSYARYLYDKSGAQPWSASEPCWGKKIIAMK